MAFGAADIMAKSFSVVFLRGYSISEVDDFLDLVTVEMEKLQQANRELEEKVATLERRIALSGTEPPHHAVTPLIDRVEEIERRIP